MEEGKLLGLPCLAGECATPEHCASEEQADPWDRTVKWRGCPGKGAFARPEIKAALMLRALSAIGPVSPERYTHAVTATLLGIKAARAEMDAAKDGRRG